MKQITEKLLNLANKAEQDLLPVYSKIDEVAFFNSQKILSSFIKNRVSYSDFTDINGYGYYDGEYFKNYCGLRLSAREGVIVGIGNH